MKIILDIPDEVYKRYKQYYEPYLVKVAGCQGCMFNNNCNLHHIKNDVCFTDNSLIF